MEDYSHWLTIDETVERTKKGRRTIERMIGRQEIRTAYDKRQEGRKPVVVISPEELPKIAAQKLRPVVENPAISAIEPTDLADLLRGLVRALGPPARVYLTVKEAAAYLGLPLAEVRRLVKAEKVPSVRLLNRSRRIARRDLDGFKYESRRVTWQNGGLENRA